MGWLYMAGLGCVEVVVRCLGSGLPGGWIAVVCVLLLTVVLLCLTSVWGDENILVGFIPPDINNGLLSIIVD